MNKNIKLSIEVLNTDEIDKVIHLFKIVWNTKDEELIFKTKWAFIKSDSLVLVMKNEKDDIIAVRGGVNWPLSLNQDEINCFQFHGTCVHPNYRRLGIFSKLNMEYLKSSSKLKKELIFNVSVKASKLGYEKLGWKYIKGFHRLTKIHVFNYNRKKIINHKDYSYNLLKHHISNSTLEARNNQFNGLVYTKYTKEFLDWRLDNEMENYSIFKLDSSFIIFKVKEYKAKRELIIGDVFLEKTSYIMFTRILDKLIDKVKPKMTTVYVSKHHPFFRYYLFNLFVPNPFNYHLNFGTRVVNSEIDFSKKKWGMSYLDIDTF